MRERHIKDINTDFFDPCFNYLVKNGFENTSIRDLCKELGLSPGSVYYLFKDKNDVFINVVRYGTGKVADKLFEFAFKTMETPKVFFETFIDEVDKYKREFRLIFQFAASPTYGDHIRDKSEGFKFVYEDYILRLSEILGAPYEEIMPIIYNLISILSDYVLWEDYDVSKLQLNYLYLIIKTKFLDNRDDVPAKETDLSPSEDGQEFSTL